MYYHIDMGKIKIKGTLSSLQLMWLTFGIVSMVLLSGILYVIVLDKLGIV
jgi:hypothetical protein